MGNVPVDAPQFRVIVTAPESRNERHDDATGRGRYALISYPGEILARFGRYEGVERVPSPPGVEVWRSWDPYLERFVTVVVLLELDQTELLRLGPKVDSLLDRHLGHGPRRRILDFAPPASASNAFFVLEWSATAPLHPDR